MNAPNSSERLAYGTSDNEIRGRYAGNALLCSVR